MINLIKVYWRIFKTNPRLFVFLAARKLGILKRICDKKYLEYEFRAIKGYPLNLEEPRTFNEKLQWLKLNDQNPLYTKLVDKYAVREYIKKELGEEYLIPLIGGPWSDSEEIDFDKLPDQFVLKCTHDSGSVVICNNKTDFDIAATKKKLNRALKNNYYDRHREWPYKDIRPQIIAEKFIGDGAKSPEDYKFFTFDGEIDSVMVCKGREHGHPWFYFYDLEWKRRIYQYPDLERKDEIDKPKDFDEMIQMVEKLAKKFRHVRIDLYYEKGKIYFGEFTLYNQSGYDNDITYETDQMWGQKLKLPAAGVWK